MLANLGDMHDVHKPALGELGELFWKWSEIRYIIPHQMKLHYTEATQQRNVVIQPTIKLYK